MQAQKEMAPSNAYSRFLSLLTAHLHKHTQIQILLLNSDWKEFYKSERGFASVLFIH